MNDTTDYRRYANRIRDAYTLDEAEIILKDLFSQAIDEARINEQELSRQAYMKLRKKAGADMITLMAVDEMIDQRLEQLTPKKDN